MPIDEDFWNPYRMIPIRDDIERSAPLTPETIRGRNGFIYCSLKNLTLLFIGKYVANHKIFAARNNEFIIPGTSLKGMLRSMVEIVGGGCRITDIEGKIDKKYQACRNPKNLCIACRMFGMMDAPSSCHQGKIAASDALIREEAPKTDKFKALLAETGTRHEPFYRSPHTDRMDGKARKLYFHQPKRTDSVPTLAQQFKFRARNIEALLPGYHFDFEIQFSNLTQQELEILVYVLSLEQNVEAAVGEEKIELKGPMRHKIGRAKPIGMGSCKITIDKIVYLSMPSKRYASLTETNDTTFEGSALEEEIARLIRRFVSDDSETMQHLRKMLIWDESDVRKFAYPDYHWFKNPDNAQKTLKTI